MQILPVFNPCEPSDTRRNFLSGTGCDEMRNNQLQTCSADSRRYENWMLLYGSGGVATATDRLKKSQKVLREVYMKLERIHAPMVAKKSESPNNTTVDTLAVLKTLEGRIELLQVCKTCKCRSRIGYGETSVIVWLLK